METIIISTKLFKENSPIKEDTMIEKFVPYLGIAQRIYIEKVLGASLLTELQTQINAANVIPAPAVNPISASNRALLQMIAPALSFYAVYQGLPFHWASIVNKGVTLRNSENSDAVSINDISQMRRWLKDDAEILLRQLIDYLCGCQASYPLWLPGNYCGGCGCDGSTPGGTFDTGIYIPKRRKRY